MATGVQEFVDSTTAAVFVPEIWSASALVAREQALVYGDLVDRRFEKELHQGDRVHVPSVGNLAARTKALSSNAAITYETVTETNTNIIVNTWEYAAMAIEDIMKIQANRDLFSLYSGKLGYALGLAFDDILAGLPDDFSQAVGALAVENEFGDFTRAIQYLDDANAPDSDRYFVMAPAAATAILVLDKFVSDDYSMLHGAGERTTRKEQAYVRSLLGVPVYKSTNVEGSNSIGHDNTIFQREALAAVMQMKPKTGHMYDLDYLVDKVAVQHLYGTLEMRDDHGVWIRGL